MKKLLVFFILVMCSNPLNVFGAIMKWDASTGDVSGYTIYYGISQGNYSLSENVGNVTQYSLSNFSLTEGTTYYFVVRAYNNSGESENSEAVIYAIPTAADTTPPMPPQSITSEVKDGNFLLTWVANNEIDLSDYRVYYGTSSRIYGLPITVTKSESLISGLDSGTIYYFALTAVDASGNESGYSSPEITNSISATPAVVPAVTPVIQQVANLVTNTEVTTNLQTSEEENLPSLSTDNLTNESDKICVTQAQAAELYVATFNRAPDAAGLYYWIESGLTIEQIARSFFDQSETQSLYPAGNTDAQFVASIYQNLFNRAPDAAGLSYWIGLTGLGGGLARPVMIEALKNGATGADRTIIDNKTEVGLYFANHGSQAVAFSLAGITDDPTTIETAKKAVDNL